MPAGARSGFAKSWPFPLALVAMPHTFSEKRKSPFRETLRQGVLIALVLSHSVAALDLICLTVLERTMALSDPFMFLSIWLWSFAVVFVSYAVPWVLIVPVTVRFLRVSGLYLSTALGVGLAFPWALLALQDPRSRASVVVNPYLVGVLLLLSLGAALTAFLFMGHVKATSRSSKILSAGILGAPLALAEILAYLWVRHYVLSGGLSITSLAAALACFIAVGCTLLVFRFERVQNHATALMLGCTLILTTLASRTSFFVAEPVVKEPNVANQNHRVERLILITVDTLRRDGVESYNPKVTTPNLQALARDSIVFSNAYAPAPWTPPSVSSIMSGLSPSVHGVTTTYGVFPDSLAILPTYFQENGYLTAAIGVNGVLAAQPALAQGFDQFLFYPGERPHSLGVLAQIVSSEGRQRLRKYKRDTRDWFSTSDVTEWTLDWIEAHQHEDFFLWVHYLDPHGPYDPPNRFRPPGKPNPSIGWTFDVPAGVDSGRVVFFPPEVRWIRKLYDAEIRYVDDGIGQIVRLLKDLGLYEQTVITLTSDHGEEFWEHSGLHHGHTLYEELLAIPLTVKLPSQGYGNRTVDRPVSIVSLLPTMLDVFGMAYNQHQFSASSLLPLWEEEAPPNDTGPVFASGVNSPLIVQAVIHEGWKYIRSQRFPQEQLYHLTEDPLEQVNLAASHPGRIRELREQLDHHLERSRRLRQLYGIGDAVDPDVQKRVLQELKSMGYIQ